MQVKVEARDQGATSDETVEVTVRVLQLCRVSRSLNHQGEEDVLIFTPTS